MSASKEEAAKQLAAAMAAFDMAKTAVNEAQARLNVLKAEVDLRRQAWIAAQVAHDTQLPCVAVLHPNSWRGGYTPHQGVITRRTGKTIYVRRAGDPHAPEKAYRESKYRPGIWIEHPRPTFGQSTEIHMEAK